LIVKDASGKESLVCLKDTTFAPIGYVSIEELPGILGLLGYDMSVSNNNGRISGYANWRYYSIDSGTVSDYVERLEAVMKMWRMI
jgi:hypothetical protein